MLAAILSLVVLKTYFSYVYTGYSERAYTLGAELCALRELVFSEVKQGLWTKVLDATAQIRDAAWSKANPPPVVTVNRHRAAKERADRRAKTKNSIFVSVCSRLDARARELIVVCCMNRAHQCALGRREVVLCKL